MNRRLALVYTLSGFTAAVASLIYVAHLGQARSDAGTGYELLAITAVVLGGTEIMGGRGSICGTLLGFAPLWCCRTGCGSRRIAGGTGGYSDQRDSGRDHRARDGS